MPETVKCKICGHLYNRRFLKAHVRRAHGKKAGRAADRESEETPIEAIVSAFESLSKEDRKFLLRRLKELAK